MSDLNTFNLEPGNNVGGYTLVSRLGGGAMGTVWRVRDDGGQIYAMKILRDSFAQEDSNNPNSTDARERATARERFRREGLALQKIKHPGVCQIVDMELDDSLAFIVTELVEGLNLRDDVRDNGPYVGEDLARLTSKLLDAVDAVHAAGIIHRDIKPTNVMISSRGPVLVDFGIAMGEGESHVTRTGLVMGTPGFIAPEIIEGAESDEATDWWSVASVLGFAAMGEPIYGTKPMMAVLEREAAGNANLAGLPPRTTYMLRQALNPDRNKRCSAQELLRVIQEDAAQGAWDSMTDTDSGDSASTGPRENSQGQVVPPFYTRGNDASPTEDGQTQPLYTAVPLNPRKLWTDPVPNPQDSSRTQVLPSEPDMAATRIMSSAALPGSTRILPASAQSADVTSPQLHYSSLSSPESQETSVLPNTSSLPETSVLPGTSILPATPPTSVLPTVSGPTIQPNPDLSSAPGLPTNPEIPTIPAFNVLWWYRRHSFLPLVLTTIPMTFLASGAPMVAVLIGFLILWIFATVGYSARARERRRERNGGIFKKSDSALTALGLPWNIIKGFLSAIGSALIGFVVSLAAGLLLSLFFGLPSSGSSAHLALSLPDRNFILPLPGGSAFSLSGLTLILSFLTGWFCCLSSHLASIIRVGFGSTRKADIPGYPSRSGSETRRWEKKTLLALILLAILIVVAIIYAGSGSIDWTPLTVTY